MQWIRLTQHCPEFQFDIRYARTDNFLEKKFYPFSEAFATTLLVNDLQRVHQQLSTEGVGLLIFDTYRPWSITQRFWNEVPAEWQAYLADPKKGSAHNRVAAVDLSLFHLSTKKPVSMPSDFDEMTEASHVTSSSGSEEQRHYRDLLQKVMKQNRFTGIKNEWWHFNHLPSLHQPVMNLDFNVLATIADSQVR